MRLERLNNLPLNTGTTNFVAIFEFFGTVCPLFFFGCSEVNSTLLITSELANQRARKVLFTCVVHANNCY